MCLYANLELTAGSSGLKRLVPTRPLPLPDTLVRQHCASLRETDRRIASYTTGLKSPTFLGFHPTIIELCQYCSLCASDLSYYRFDKWFFFYIYRELKRSDPIQKWRCKRRIPNAFITFCAVFENSKQIQPRFELATAGMTVRSV